MMDAAGNMYIFLPADAIDTKRRIDVAMKAGVYQQISKMSSNYIPKSMKVNGKRRVTRYIFPSRNHFLCQDRANRAQ